MQVKFNVKPVMVKLTSMDEMYQFATLSMGWCINCHRDTQVQFKNNGILQYL